MASEKRLIDANALRMQFNDIPPFIGMTGGCVQQYIDQSPTVDAVEVVRCKDCKFYELKWHVTDGKQRMCCENNKGIWTSTPPDAFCSYGERKDNVEQID